MNALRKIAAGSLAAVLACSMAACGSGNANSTDSASNTGKTVKVDEKSAKATSISDFGGMDGLVAAAEKEGALNVIMARFFHQYFSRLRMYMVSITN